MVLPHFPPTTRKGAPVIRRSHTPTRCAVVRIGGRTLQVLITEDQVITQQIIYPAQHEKVHILPQALHKPIIIGG